MQLTIDRMFFLGIILNGVHEKFIHRNYFYTQ